MKKVLIITYYWPPGGGAGVQRWLKFVKYLPEFNWQPVIFTPENGEMPVTDNSLLKDIPKGTEVIRTKIWEPYSIYKKFIGAGNEKINTGFLTEKKKPGLAEKVSVWMRGNFFIPDARCFWIKPSVKFLSSYLEKNKIDAIVSTGPPHSMHLIAMEISEKFNIPWVADFRDPWTNIDYYKDLMLTAYADANHHKLERQVVTKATRVVVVGKTMKEDFEKQYNRKVEVITNGYDSDDVGTGAGSRQSAIGSLQSEAESRHDAAGSRQLEQLKLVNHFVIAHVGTLVRSRNPEALWKAIAATVKTNSEFAGLLQIRLTGKVDIAVRNSLQDSGLEKFVTYIDYLPHDQVICEQQQASVLLLVLNNTPNAKGILTGKLFEYLAARRPILCIGPPDGDAAEIINETKSGQTINFNDQSEMDLAIADLYSKFKSGTLNVKGSGVEKYSRKALTGEMVKVLEGLLK